MAFNMKGSPAKLGMIQGTKGHSSALKKLSEKDSPLDHTTKREGHESDYGKGHANSKHPDYWKVKKQTVTYSKKNPEYDENKGRKADGSLDPDYKVDARLPDHKSKDVYLSDKDSEIQTTRNKKKGASYTGKEIFEEDDTERAFTSTNNASRVGKTDRNTYKTGKKKSKATTTSKTTTAPKTTTTPKKYSSTKSTDGGKTVTEKSVSEKLSDLSANLKSKSKKKGSKRLTTSQKTSEKNRVKLAKKVTLAGKVTGSKNIRDLAQKEIGEIKSGRDNPKTGTVVSRWFGKRKAKRNQRQLDKRSKSSSSDGVYERMIERKKRVKRINAANA